MLKIEFDKEASIAILQPQGALSEGDFETASSIIDPFLETHGELKGLVIYTKEFPGWESFGTMLKHFEFVKDHHQKLAHIALVTDSKIGNLAEKIVAHFISADVKHFSYRQLGDAKAWIVAGGVD